jgi:hypothetical protein
MTRRTNSLRKGVLAVVFALVAATGIVGGSAITGHAIPASHAIAGDAYPLPPVR